KPGSGVRQATMSAPAVTASTIASAWSETTTWMVPTTTGSVGSTTSSSKPRADARACGQHELALRMERDVAPCCGASGRPAFLAVAEAGHGRAAAEARLEAPLHARVVGVERARRDG